MDFFLAFHYPSGKVIVLQECEHCFAIILNASCPHHCPELGPEVTENEDVTLLNYILSGIGEIRNITDTIMAVSSLGDCT